MGIPWLFLILSALALIALLIPGIQYGAEGLILPAITIGFFLLRRFLMQRAYQQQYQQYQQQRQQSPGAGSASGTWSHASGSAGTGGSTGTQGAGSFYGSFRNWGGGPQGAGFRQPQSPPLAKDPHVILGVARGASMDEIKKAYREKLKKYHPDIVANLKLGDEYKEMFEEKTREIQHAYEQLGGR